MNYLVHAHDNGAVLSANYLETRGGTRHIVGDHMKVTGDMVVLMSADSSYLKGKCLRRVRADNQNLLGVTIPAWAESVREVIMLNADMVGTDKQQYALRQLHSRLTGIPLPRTRRTRRAGRGQRRDFTSRMCDW